MASKLTVAGKSVSYGKSDGTFDQVTKNDDGSTTIKTGGRTIIVGPPGGDGNGTITSITDNGPGSGSGSGSGSSGSGMSCGGTGQPSCAVTVDDSGFQGKDTAVNTKADAAIAKLDERVTQVQGVNDGSTFGVDTSWIPSLKPGPVVACSDIQWQPGISHGPLAGLTGSVSVNWCDKADVIREYLAWLFGVATVFAIALLFFSSNKSGGGK